MPRRSSLLCFVDGAEIAFALVNDTKRYLSFIGNVGKSNGPSASVGVAIEALELAIVAGRRQLKGARLAISNTSAKRFTDKEIPPGKVPCGFIILKVPSLSASISENSFGYIILMRKGVVIETTMFAMLEKVMIMPEVSRVRRNIAGVNDKI